MKRADEEFCRAQFDAFVKRFFISTDVIWEEVPQQDEPPDYYLLLKDTRFAVEVTTLIEKVLVGTSVFLPYAVTGRILQQFVSEIENTARTEGYLRGNYLVSFSRPIDDFATVRDNIRVKLLEHIQSTSHLEQTSLEIIFEHTVTQQRPQQCGVQKVGNKPDRVVLGGPVQMKWEGDAAEDICGLLNKNLDTKAGKLKDISEPKILLLLDEYQFADRQMYARCTYQLPSLSSFHTVFVTEDANKGFVLCSQNHDWLK